MKHTAPDGGITRSIWADDSPRSYDTRPGPETDVCIIGAGISGLTTAYELVRRGVRVAVLDDGPLGGGETGRTSAHLASAVDEHYSMLEDRFGEDAAKLVHESHATAIDYIETTAKDLGIDCDFQRVDAYLFPRPGQHADREFDQELAAAQRAGLAVTRVDRVPLPGVDLGPALRYGRQAEFHPLKYLAGLAQAIVQLGGSIHTHVRVEKIEPGEPLRLELDGGRSLLCRSAVDATNGAMTSPLKLTIRQAAYRTYMLGFAIEAGSVPHGLYWDWDDPYHYIRVVRGATGGETLIVGGGDHRVGQGDPQAAWAELEAWVRKYLPFAGTTTHRWSGQIIEPADGLAHIGKSPDIEHVFVVTGDSGNGLTHGTIAGLVLPDLIQGKQHAWAELYSPKRTRLRGLATLVREASHSSAPYVDWLRSGDVTSLEDIPRGQGRILRRGLHLVAAYCDDAGTCHLRSATCPHLRGVVHWNDGEKTWDCPCHGSRFDAYGRRVNGPAMSDLSAVDEPALTPEPVRVPDSDGKRHPETPAFSFDPAIKRT